MNKTNKNLYAIRLQKVVLLLARCYSSSSLILFYLLNIIRFSGAKHLAFLTTVTEMNRIEISSIEKCEWWISKCRIHNTYTQSFKYYHWATMYLIVPIWNRGMEIYNTLIVCVNQYYRKIEEKIFQVQVNIFSYINWSLKFLSCFSNKFSIIAFSSLSVSKADFF